MISAVWCAMILFSVIYAAVSGNIKALSSEMFSGAAETVELCISMGGMMCLWSGIMRLLEKCGAMRAIARLMKPLLKRLYPVSGNDRETAGAITGNFSANFLGVGNAATPFGIKAADLIASKTTGKARTRELSTLIVMNTASVQLIPTTICVLRAMYGAASPFDIIPAVWICSLLSVSGGIIMVRFLCGK